MVQNSKNPRGICVESTHMLLLGNNLHTMTKDPTARSNLPYMGKESPRSWDLFLYKDIPPISSDSDQLSLFFRYILWRIRRWSTHWQFCASSVSLLNFEFLGFRWDFCLQRKNSHCMISEILGPLWKEAKWTLCRCYNGESTKVLQVNCCDCLFLWIFLRDWIPVVVL